MASRVAFGTVSWFFDPVFQVPAVLEKGKQRGNSRAGSAARGGARLGCLRDFGNLVCRQHIL